MKKKGKFVNVNPVFLSLIVVCMVLFLLGGWKLLVVVLAGCLIISFLLWGFFDDNTPKFG